MRCEKPWSASFGATKKTSASASVTSTSDDAARVGSERRDTLAEVSQGRGGLPTCDNAHMLTTPLCRRLGIEAPVFSVGFGASAGPELAAAVSNAGGCGVLGGSGMRELLRPRIERTRELTGRPFGVNLLLHEDQRATAAVALEHGVPILVLFWGDAAPIVELAARDPFAIPQLASAAEPNPAPAPRVAA